MTTIIKKKKKKTLYGNIKEIINWNDNKNIDSIVNFVKIFIKSFYIFYKVMKYDFAIIGSGIIGLTLAFKLKEKFRLTL